jgi:hypothetical protein
VSVITWGTPDAALLRNSAIRLPAGRVTPTSEVEQLAGALRLDWEMATGGSYVAHPAGVQLKVGRQSDPLRSNEKTSVVAGFHTATMRDGATSVAVAREIPTQPLIARWDHKLGRVCSVLFPVQSLDASDEADSALLSLLVEQVRWAARSETDPAVRTIVELAVPTVTIRLLGSDASGANAPPGESLDLEVTRADGSAVAKTPFYRDGSEWKGQFQLTGPLSHMATVRTKDQVLARCTPTMLPRSTEFLKVPDRGAGRAVLARLAAESSGGEWQPGMAFFDGVTESYRSLTPAFAWCAIVFLLLDIADRRYQFASKMQRHWQKRMVSRRVKQEVSEPQREPDSDPFEVAKERMRRRVQR